MAKKRIKIVCSSCGSEDVRRDATASWNVDTQEWELAAVMDTGYCEGKCEGESLLLTVEIEGKAGETLSNDPFVASGSSDSPALEPLAEDLTKPQLQDFQEKNLTNHRHVVHSVCSVKRQSRRRIDD